MTDEEHCAPSTATHAPAHQPHPPREAQTSQPLSAAHPVLGENADGPHAVPAAARTNAPKTRSAERNVAAGRRRRGEGRV